MGVEDAVALGTLLETVTPMLYGDEVSNDVALTVAIQAFDKVRCECSQWPVNSPCGTKLEVIQRNASYQEADPQDLGL